MDLVSRPLDRASAKDIELKFQEKHSDNVRVILQVPQNWSPNFAETGTK